MRGEKQLEPHDQHGHHSVDDRLEDVVHHGRVNCVLLCNGLSRPGGQEGPAGGIEDQDQGQKDRGEEEGEADLARHLPPEEVKLHRAGVQQRVETLNSRNNI